MTGWLIGTALVVLVVVFLLVLTHIARVGRMAINLKIAMLGLDFTAHPHTPPPEKPELPPTAE